MQTSILHRLQKGNFTRIGRFFAVIAFAAFTALATLGPAISVSAASYIPNGTRWTWVNEAKIEATVSFKATFTDANPFDLDRKFTTTVSQGIADSYKRDCTNYDGNPSNLYWIIPKSPTKATFYEVEKRDSRGECKMLSKEITLRSPDKAKVQAEQCTDVIGPPAPGSPIANKCNIRNANWIEQCANFSSPFPPTGHICTPTAAPTVISATPSDPTNADGNEPDPCDSLGDFSFRWIACPLLTAGAETAKVMDSLIESQLHYGTAIFDRSSEEGRGFYQAWGTFRSIALALVLIVGLVMVVSQGTGLQLFDAYTVRKVMPRLLIAVIGITLSWPILQFVVTLFNDLGHGIQDLILLPFKDAAKTTEAMFEGNTTLGGMLAAALTVGAAIPYLWSLGSLGVMTLLGTVLLALLVAFLVLLIRSVVITAAILFAPLAIACYILPNTKKIWDFWQNALVTALMIFPIIMLLIGAGKAMSYISGNGFMKILFMLAPYFFLPFAFKLAGGLMSTIFSLANDRGKGGFDRLRNIRDDQRKKRKQEALEGRDTSLMGKTMGSVYRRAHIASQPGAGGIRGAFGARYQAGREKFMAGVTAKMLDDDHGRAAGDDDATSLALQAGMTESKFIEQYMAKLKDGTAAEKRARAVHALRTLETGFGAKIGSDAMRVTAYKALASSSTGFKPDENGPAYDAMTRAGASLMDAGLMNAADAAAALKANKARSDISGVGFGKLIATMAEGHKRLRAGKSQLVTDDEAEALALDAINGSQPGQLIGGRHEAVTALAPTMFKRLQQKYTAMKQAESDPSVSQAERERVTADFMHDLAARSADYELMAQISPHSAGILRENLISKTLDGAPVNEAGQAVNVQQMIEAARTNQVFVTFRREYGNAASIYAQEQARQQPTNGPGGMPNPGAGLPPVRR